MFNYSCATVIESARRFYMVTTRGPGFFGVKGST